MSPNHQPVINTLAYWTGQLVLADADSGLFLRNLVNLQRDLATHQRILTPRQIVDDADDEGLTEPWENV